MKPKLAILECILQNLIRCNRVGRRDELVMWMSSHQEIEGQILKPSRSSILFEALSSHSALQINHFTLLIILIIHNYHCDECGAMTRRSGTLIMHLAKWVI